LDAPTGLALDFIRESGILGTNRVVKKLREEQMGKVEIRPVKTHRELEQFILFPWKIYARDPYWVPPLISERKAFFDPARNPFFRHAEVQLFLALKDGELAGTISAHINYIHNDFHQEKAGFFGFFESIEDFDVAQKLLDTACQWVAERGMEVIRGPMNFSTNEECGLLVEGFDSRPVVMMTYNPRYYVDFIERAGFTKAMDLYAYILKAEDFKNNAENLPGKVFKAAEAALGHPKVKIRNLNLKDFDREVERGWKVYNSAWSRNWGFVPLTKEEFEHIAYGLKAFLDPDLVFVAEVDGEPVGLSVTLPDLNIPLHKMNGRLFPLGWLKFFWYRRKIDTARFFMMGVVEGYRTMGIDAVFYLETARALLRKGYKYCEASWILENNTMMNRIIQRLGGRVYKVYRIYEKSLA
jgi:GNAT superfamily N-acetyltransferase